MRRRLATHVPATLAAATRSAPLRRMEASADINAVVKANVQTTHVIIEASARCQGATSVTTHANATIIIMESVANLSATYVRRIPPVKTAELV